MSVCVCLCVCVCLSVCACLGAAVHQTRKIIGFHGQPDKDT